MVFFGVTLAMKVRQRKFTKQALKEIGKYIFDGGGLIRSYSNEGIIRPYARFRDTANKTSTYARYIQLQCDLSEDQAKNLQKRLQEHPDIYVHHVQNLERPISFRRNPNFFPLDTFVRLEEEINWPPQASSDLYSQMDMNWKEFSRTRWSNYLRN